ncbi:MAG: hypothetical protein IPK52_08795 [Chloroflexi bacterium]|nr:hypothetical protein [Chloroflexota bacterium]
MTAIYFDDDVTLEPLRGKSAGIFGYSELGQALALNLRDSGIPVFTAPESARQQAAAEMDLIPVLDVGELTRRCTVLIFVTPDDALPTLYMDGIAPHLKRGDLLVFTSGYTMAFGVVEPPPFVDVGILAPRTTGQSVRTGYETGQGALTFLSVAAASSRQALDRMLALAKGAGLLRGGALEILPEHEAYLSLFVQQAVIPAFHHIMVVAAELLVRQGIPPEAAFADLHIGGRFFDYLMQSNREGLMHTLMKSPLTAQYAALSRMARFAELRLERMMENTFEEIVSGAFAKEWSREMMEGMPRLDRLRKQEAERSVWDFEQQTLDLMREGR